MYWFSQRKHGKGTNVYGVEMCPLEFLDVHPSSQSMWTASPAAHASEARPLPTPPSCGTVDCGATASAGPKPASSGSRLCARRLTPKALFTLIPINDLISGIWLWQVGQSCGSYHFQLSGPPKTFSVFVLPNLQEIYEPWFDAEIMLVPILVGMDFLGSKGVGMIIAFNDGHCWASQLDGSAPMDLPQNH